MCPMSEHWLHSASVTCLNASIPHGVLISEGVIYRMRPENVLCQSIGSTLPPSHASTLAYHMLFSGNFYRIPLNLFRLANYIKSAARILNTLLRICGMQLRSSFMPGVTVDTCSFHWVVYGMV